MSDTTLRVTGSRIEYDYAVVTVEPFESVSDSGKRFMVQGFLGYLADQGRYVRARGRLILKDESLGARVMDAFTAATPEGIEAVAALIKDGA
jgi:hypothetical protein